MLMLPIHKSSNGTGSIRNAKNPPDKLPSLSQGDESDISTIKERIPGLAPRQVPVNRVYIHLRLAPPAAIDSKE
ncbi:hypothetical protein Cmtc_26650 [Cupriavidus sp. TKC]|nr:hypothetical protein Cmtc_26650 [Cupriavidus sp. TKC]